MVLGPRWPSGKVSTSGRRIPCSKPDSTEDPYVRQLRVRSYVVGQTSSRLCCTGLWREGVPAQVSSSSPERGSKLRRPSQNSPRVAPNRDVNIIKTKQKHNIVRFSLSFIV
ncbi:hypothetical protein AVEN_113319-1 [Araneus ventricosus]|uniref:Uncharacterized protein n=1 Tax=Araneus ventricosus TaxID=182803 RepID=A0A4Y2PPW7_ARAVE|nr:hypothetical protein AVEN_113319-1 [Araneus ventricosus]